MSRFVPLRLALVCAMFATGALVLVQGDRPVLATATQTFVFTGGPQLYVVPDGVTAINVTVKGGRGGTPPSGGTGGAGATVTATIAVTPGETLQVMVGGAGVAGGGGYNGGARGAGGGGGASDIRRPAFSTTSSCAFTLSCGAAERIVVAGGGGGGGWATSFASTGAHGGDAGQTSTAGTAINATINAVLGDATAGGAGSNGGAGGTGTRVAGAGAGAGGSGHGGEGSWIAGATGGGGGGGYVGGGGGGTSSQGNNPYTPNGTAGGGGGSSWAGGTGVSNAVFTDGSNNSAGEVIIDPPSAITGATFTFTGGAQFYTVPAGIDEVFMRLYGAGSGAPGDIVYGTLAATPGEVLQVMIGGRGWGSTPDPGYTAWQGGFNGGGPGAYGPFDGTGGGGGATDIRRCANASNANPCGLNDRVLVSGGGGGSGHGSWGLSGGAGGALADGSGADAATGCCNTHGRGATPTAGGATGGQLSTAGTFGQGGSGNSNGAASVSGGGGGGYYGGGGGDGVGGGGGSSYSSSTGLPGAVSDLATVAAISTARFRHTQAAGGSYTDGMAVITAMPQASTAVPRNVSDSGALVSGTLNARHLASTPTVYYSTSQATVEGGGGSTQNLTTTSGLAIVAGSTTYDVSARLTGLSSGTTYYYKLCARSVAGAGCGVVRTFTTQAAGFPYFVDDTPTSSIPTTGSYSYTFTAAGSPAPTLSLFSGSLPPGMTFDPVTGVLTGTPTTGGTYNFVLRASNSVGNADTPISITVTAPAPPQQVLAPPPSSSSTTRPPSTTLPTPMPDTAGALPRPAPGNGEATENGRVVPVVVAVENRSDLVMRGDDFELRLSGECESGCDIVTTPSGRQVITLEERGIANVSGNGFAAGTEVDVWIFSTPRYLGRLIVGPNGSFSGQLPLDDVPFGEHTLQVNGTSADGVARSANIGVIVGRVPITLPVTGRGSDTGTWALVLVAAGLVILMSRRRDTRPS